MSHAIELNPDRERRRAAAVAEIARDTETSSDVVRSIYDEEVASLSKDARIKQYVPVIAIKRVKARVRNLGAMH